MKADFIRKNNSSSKLALIFAGWGTDPEFYRPMISSIPEEWDVLVAHGYSDFNFQTTLLDSYHSIYLFAWSLGVEAAERSLAPEKITAAYAFNGTGCAVSDLFGIPVDIFRGTADNLSEKNLMKFRRRMTASLEEYKEILPILPSDPNIPLLQSQLYSFINSEVDSSSATGQDRAHTKLPWVRAYIGKEDRIFPPHSQKAFWTTFSPLTTIEFRNFAHTTPLASLIKENIPDLKEIGKQFEAAFNTYNSHATAQRLIAYHLISFIGEQEYQTQGSLLEIGPGTGQFTFQYAPLLSPQSATFIDLYPLKPFHIAEEECYIVGDAEEWISQNDETFDYIVSSAAIQWFSNPEGFFRKAARSLKPGGLFAVSTFIPGNLWELDTIRPTPIRYPSYQQIEEWVSKYFKQYTLSTESIEIEFDSPREAILHIKHTGVTGPRHTSRYKKKRLALDRLPRNAKGKITLTFRPLYILATH